MTPFLARQRTDRNFERLYRKHAGDVYRYALVVLRNEADAEDVTQTTFLNAYRAIAKGERPRTPQNWLIAIAHNVCRQRFRQSQRRPNEVELHEELAEASHEEEERVSAEDIRRALGHLAFNQRAALVMRELEGRSYQQIAEILGLSVSAVETLIFRARRALREQLEEGITCHEAELAISRQLDGRLGRSERGALRAHLRECEDCARFARRQRAQRGAIKSLALIPLPASLSSFFGQHGGSAAAGGSAVLGGGIAIKAAAIGATAVVATGVGYEGARHTVWRPATAKPAAAAVPPAVAQRAAAPVYHPQSVATDEKPFRRSSVAARARHHGRPAVLHGRQHELSSLPPSRLREQDLKPTHPAKPGKAQNPGRHLGPQKTHPNQGQGHGNGHGQGGGNGHGQSGGNGHGGKP
ncbi:MAG: sigma-70 family RNA polymerase sigma factor [Gaiellaceae bacterium]